MEHARGNLIATEAERLLERVKHTDFARKPVIDRNTDTYEVDDGAFVAFLLEHFAPREIDPIPKAAGERYPSATEFHDFFTTLPYHRWTRVIALADMRRGDIIAWSDSRAKDGGGHGHVAIVRSEPKYDTEADEWTIDVFDSSSSAHFDDSRLQGPQYRAGLGTGALKMQTDAAGAPSAVRAGPQSKFRKWPIAIGRIEDAAQSGQPRPAPQPRATVTAFGQRIERPAAANEVLGDGEFALATYTLASTAGMLLHPTTLACWGAGQTVPPSLGSGAVTYNFAGGVVFRNL